MLLAGAIPAVGDDAVWVDTAKGRYEFPGKNDVWNVVPARKAGDSHCD
jgi:hypothetical protein